MPHLTYVPQAKPTNAARNHMMHLLLLVSLLLCATLFSFDSVRAAEGHTADVHGGTFLIEFTPDSTLAERDAILVELGVSVVRWLAPIHVAEVRFNTSIPLQEVADEISAAQAADVALAELTQRVQSGTAAQSGVVMVEANAVVTGADMPNDPDLGSIERSYGLSVTHALEGWEYTKGSADILIAVLDTGLNLNHPEFAERIVPGYDFVNDDDEPMDDNGHGTHASGIVAAGIDNGIGMVGVCPGCSLMPVKVLNQNNAGTWSGVASGIIYAADNGARVINLSLGAAVSSQTLENAIVYAQSKDVLVVAAAGNMGVDREFYPAALPGVFAVSATDAYDRHWSLSNYGSYVDVAAPGYAIYSTYYDLDNYYGGYTYMSGTSMASPFAAGLAGLLLSQNPDRTADEVAMLIRSTVDRVGTSEEVNYFGQGRINVARALAVASDSQWTQVVNGENKDNTTEAGANILYLPIVIR